MKSESAQSSNQNYRITIPSKPQNNELIPFFHNNFSSNSQSTQSQEEVINQVTTAVNENNITAAAQKAISFIQSIPEDKFDEVYPAFLKIGSQLKNISFMNELENYKAQRNFKLQERYASPPNPVNESDVQTFASSRHECPGIVINFDKVDFLKVLDPAFPCVTSAEKAAIKAVIPSVGVVSDKDSYHVGTCFRISDNKVLMPLHCARHTNGGKVTFCNSENMSYINVAFNTIVEKHDGIDMAVVELNHSIDLPIVTKFADTVLEGERLFLLHRPTTAADSFLQISGNQVQIATTADQKSFVLTHDTDFGSSGGVYVNNCGEIVGIHIGADRAREDISGRQVYGCTMDGILDKLPSDSEIFDFLVPEGNLSKPEIMKRLKTAVDTNCITNSAVKARISELLKEYDETKFYPKTTEHLRKAAKSPGTDPVGDEIKNIMNDFQDFLGKAGLHSDTKDWSVKCHVDSEHPIPHRVFKAATKNKVLQDYLKGAGRSRAGEDCMPAITVEHHKHAVLPTTRNNNKRFCAELIELGDDHNIPQLLWRVLDSYDNTDPNKKLLTTTYKNGLLKLFNTSGQYYQKMVEDDIQTITDPVKKVSLKTKMAECVTRIQNI